MKHRIFAKRVYKNYQILCYDQYNRSKNLKPWAKYQEGFTLLEMLKCYKKEGGHTFYIEKRNLFQREEDYIYDEFDINIDLELIVETKYYKIDGKNYRILYKSYDRSNDSIDLYIDYETEYIDSEKSEELLNIWNSFREWEESYDEIKREIDDLNKLGERISQIPKRESLYSKFIKWFKR